MPRAVPERWWDVQPGWPPRADGAECSGCGSWGSWFVFWLFLSWIYSAGATTGLWGGYGAEFEVWFGFEALLGSVLRTRQPWRLWRCLGSLGTRSSCQHLETAFVAFVQGQGFIVSWSASG